MLDDDFGVTVDEQTYIGPCDERFIDIVADVGHDDPYGAVHVIVECLGQCQSFMQRRWLRILIGGASTETVGRAVRRLIFLLGVRLALVHDDNINFIAVVILQTFEGRTATIRDRTCNRTGDEHCGFVFPQRGESHWLASDRVDCDIRRRVAMMFNTNQIYDLAPKDVEVFRKDGVTYIDASYEKRVPIMGNIDAVMKFDDLKVVAGNKLL